VPGDKSFNGAAVIGRASVGLNKGQLTDHSIWPATVNLVMLGGNSGTAQGSHIVIPL